ncbi:MarR family transcriptional regulator [Yinghuangia aomiensis]
MRSSMVTSGAVTQRLDRLESAGLLERRRGAGDGRTVHVRLTTAGRTLIDRAVADHVATEHRLLASSTVEQRAAIDGGAAGAAGGVEAGKDRAAARSTSLRLGGTQPRGRGATGPHGHVTEWPCGCVAA